MQRKWAVRPDQGEMLSREALIGALVDGATMLDIAGGCLEVVVGRTPTGVPGEMVMNGAVLCWRDRTDAKPQAEQATVVVSEPEPLQVEEPEDGFKFEPTAEITDDNPDGFDYDKLAEEDVDEPVATR